METTNLDTTFRTAFPIRRRLLLASILGLLGTAAGCQAPFAGECPPGEIALDGYCEPAEVGSALGELELQDPLLGDDTSALEPIRTIPTPTTELVTTSSSMVIEPTDASTPTTELVTTTGSVWVTSRYGRPDDEARILNDAASRKALDEPRRRLLSALEAESQGPVSLRMDAATGAIVLLQAVVSTYTASGDSHALVAQSWLERYMPLIDPRIDALELVVRERSSCIPSDDEPTAQPGVIVFDRKINGVPVMGGTLSIRFGVGGALVQIQNSLPSIAAPTYVKANPSGNAEGSKSPGSLMSQSSHRVLVATKVGDSATLRSGSLEPRADGTKVVVELDDGKQLGPWPLSIGSEPEFPASARVHVDDRTGLPDFISHRPHGGLQIASPGPISAQEVAYRYLEERPSVLRTGRPRCQLQTVDVRDSRTVGPVTYVRLGQMIGRWPVFGAELVFEIEGDRVMSVQGHTIPEADMILDPSISSSEAEEIARNALRHQGFQEINAESARVELLVFPAEIVAGLSDPSSYLAYRVEIEDYVLFVDAVEGRVLYGYPRFAAARRVVRDGQGKRESEHESFITYVVNGVPTRELGLGSELETAAQDLEQVYEYYSRFGWDGFNGVGSEAVVNVDVNVRATSPSSMAFYSGRYDQTFFESGAAFGDILGHEYTHGVIRHSSSLVYADESGALNESYADIMGELAFPDGSTLGWVGERRTTHFVDSKISHYGAYQSRSDLGCESVQLDDPECDHGGVHTNSGITNRAHAILADGDGGVAGGDIEGIGRHKLQFLAFETMTERLSPWSRMVDSALSTLASCEAMVANPGEVFGAPELSAHDCYEVEAAFSLVGLSLDTISDWIPVGREFEGAYTESIDGAMTENGCEITALTVAMSTPTGQYSETTEEGGGVAVDYHGIMKVSVPETAPPIGTIVRTHTVEWRIDHGKRPDELLAFTAMDHPPVGNDSDCYDGSGLLQKPWSKPRNGSWWSCSLIRLDSNGDPYCWGEAKTGESRSTMDRSCRLESTKIEIWSPRQGRWKRGDEWVWDSETGLVMGVELTAYRAVWMREQPDDWSGEVIGQRDLAARVQWFIDPFLSKVRWRLRYMVAAPDGHECKP